MAESICHDLRYRFRIFPRPDQVACYVWGSCEKEAIQAGPFTVMDLPHMDQHVRAARLAPDGHRELVLIRWKVPQPVHGRRRPMRDDALIWCPFPGMNMWSKLKPCTSQIPVIWDGTPH